MEIRGYFLFLATSQLGQNHNAGPQSEYSAEENLASFDVEVHVGAVTSLYRP